MKQRLAVVVGLDYHVRLLANSVNREAHGWHFKPYGSSRLGTLNALWALRHADALICFGGPAPNAALSIAAKRLNVPVFVIWAGSDVIKAQSDPFHMEIIKQERFEHLAVAPWLVDELRDLGVEAKYVPVAGVSAGNPIKPLPEAFRVLTYLPEPRRNFYGAPLVYEAARNMPEVEFDVVGAGRHDSEAPSNVRFLGHVQNMQQLLDHSTVLLRQPKHDGMSVLVLEALSRARHVLWSYEFPHVRRAGSVEDVLNELRELKRAHDAGELQCNFDGRAFVLREFARSEVTANLIGNLNSAIDNYAKRRRQEKRRVAVSGLGLFCGGVADHAHRLTPGWDVRILRTNSRLGLFASLAVMFGSDVWYSIGTGPSDRVLHWVARILRKPRVIHWVGSDIAKLKRDPKLRASLSSPDILHLAEISWTASQLKAAGLNARIAPLPPRHRSNGCAPLPERFTIMFYVPRTRADFYGRRSFERLMRNLRHKDIRYIVVGGGNITAPPGVDLENLGWRDNLHQLYREVTTLIRYTPRDGLSLMVLEALSYGRHVLWTQRLPYVRRIRHYKDMERQISELIAEHERGELQPQAAASAFILQQYAPETCMRAIAQAWEDAAERRSSTAPMVMPVQ